MNSDLQQITSNIIQQMPPQTRFRPGDIEVIHQYQTQLLGFEDTLVAGFYDTLFSHPPTAVIFSEGERPDREQTLRNWWQRTVTGKFDQDYWVWQALVGLIHVKRQVKNPMMIGMWGWALTNVREGLQEDISPDELAKLMASLERLAATCQALTAESYLEHYLIALREATGFNQKLLDQMVRNGVDELLGGR